MATFPWKKSGDSGTDGGYVVQKGDNLTNIAKRNNTTVEAIAAANNIKNVNRIGAGQRLVMPGQKATAPAAKADVPNPRPRPQREANVPTPRPRPKVEANVPTPRPRPNKTRTANSDLSPAQHAEVKKRMQPPPKPSSTIRVSARSDLTDAQRKKVRDYNTPEAAGQRAGDQVRSSSVANYRKRLEREGKLSPETINSMVAKFSGMVGK